MPTRLAAALVACVAWVGLALQFSASLALVGGAAGAAWTMLGYFTITTNLIVAILFSLIALGRPAAAQPRLVAGVALNMLLVGIVFALLLHGLRELSGGAAGADFILHKVTPVLVPLFWLLFTPKGSLGASDPPLWLAYPALYLVYALVRGTAERRYAYPFLDVAAHGWAGVALNVLVMGIGVLAASYALVLLDRRLAGRR
ncbi:MAG TPA: Pr6Pr family membrane protein [Lichenihabitans sp.]|nr:Pr6Pr family membrane protein [Lichenihabitans sp.]